jgi:hypothetical protein
LSWQQHCTLSGWAGLELTENTRHALAGSTSGGPIPSHSHHKPAADGDVYYLPYKPRRQCRRQSTYMPNWASGRWQSFHTATPDAATPMLWPGQSERAEISIPTLRESRSEARYAIGRVGESGTASHLPPRKRKEEEEGVDQFRFYLQLQGFQVDRQTDRQTDRQRHSSHLAVVVVVAPC